MKTVEYDEMPEVCLQVIREVEVSGDSVEVTKNGVARLRILPLSDTEVAEWEAGRTLISRVRRRR